MRKLLRGLQSMEDGAVDVDVGRLWRNATWRHTRVDVIVTSFFTNLKKEEKFLS
jgi:hypothetical protein